MATPEAIARKAAFGRKYSADEACTDDELALNGSPRIGDRDKLLERLQQRHREGGERPSPTTKALKP